MNYPLNFRFKIVTLAEKIEVTDANGDLICFVRKKKFRLKEHVTVFADQEMQHLLCDIKADRMLDFSATYTFTDPKGTEFGSISRKGMRSLWAANYSVFDANKEHVLEIDEDNPWVKVMDGILGELPIIGIISNFIFQPTFTVLDPNTQEAKFRIAKKPAFFEGLFTLEKLADTDEANTMRTLMGVMMMLMLERYRG